MPVMKKLTVGGTTYDTVGEASVNAVVSSGTKIATVTIDGTATDLYAPGGSTVTVTQSLSSGTQVGSISVDGTSTALYAPTPPTASTTAPSMDGTASYGSGTSYARSNHVHPTDTSRAASSHTHGSISNAGAITSDTTVASGDKLVITDSSDSSKLKRSGIAFGSSTSTFLRNDGTWAEPSGGGGSGGGAGTWYGTCRTVAAIGNKDVTCDSGFSLETGTILCVTFENTNLYEPNTFPMALSVNNGGFVSVYVRGISTIAIPWEAGDTLTFVYDGSHWRFLSTDNPLALLPSASVLSRGVVKVGSGLDISADGTLSVATQGAHSLTIVGSASIGGHCVSVSTDGTYATGSYETSAMADDTVTVVYYNHWSPTIIRVDTGVEITATLLRKEYVGAAYCGIYEFTMPDSDVTLDCWYDD